MKNFLISLWILLFLAIAFANGQTRGEQFEKKYGKPISEKENTGEFYVRQDIILKVTYDDKNLPEKFLIFPANDLTAIEARLSDEIKKEIIPTKERIGKSSNMSFQSSCSGVGIERYRNVKILTYGSCKGVVKIEVEFGKFPEPVTIIPEEDL